ncbi:MAG: PAS domain-containing protein [Myxococcales bacterium]|nr:PAS domain-containing protein [Myxococcales bacterium]
MHSSPDVVAPPAWPLDPSPAPSRRALVAVHVAAFAAMSLLFPRVGAPAALVGVLAILFTAVRSGALYGAASALVVSAGQLLVLFLLTPPLLERIVGEWRGMGTLLFVGLGVLVGRVTDLRREADRRAADLDAALAELQRSRAGLEALFEHVDTAFWVLDPDLRLRTSNRRFQDDWRRLYGRALQPGDRPVRRGRHARSWAEQYARALAGEVVFAEFHDPDHDPPLHFDVTLSPIRLPDGTVDGVMGFARDVAPRERAEARYRALVEGAPDAILVCRRGVIVSANPAAVALFEAADDAGLLGRLLDDLAPLDDASQRPVRPGTRCRRVERPDDPPVRLEAADVDLGEGATLTFLSDVSERDALEARLRLTDRLATVGTLAAGVAHQINNPLAYLTANLDWLDDELDRLQGRFAADEHAELGAVVDEMRDGAARVGQIVRDLALFARPDAEGAAAVDLHALLDRTLTLMGSRLRPGTEVVRAYAAKRRPWCNEGRLAHVLLNLLVNAADSARDDGRAHRLSVRTTDQPDGGVRVVVADTGVGIAPDLLPRVCEPFFRGRRDGGGAGLGLSIGHALVDAMGGTLTLSSTVDEGTEVVVDLPAAPTSDDPTGAPPAADRPLKILAIDDEPLVLRALVRGLREHGVTPFDDPRRGLQAALTQPFDVLLCDANMPRVDGLAIYAALEAARPSHAARLVLMTGGALNDADAQRLAACPAPVLTKPFDNETLRAALRAVAAAAQPRDR